MGQKYTGKSYVGMAGCPICGQDSGVLMDRHLRDTFEDGKRYALVCAECEKHLKAGGTFLVEVRDGEKGENPYRTGYLVGLSRQGADRVGLGGKCMAYVYESVLKIMMGETYKQEVQNARTEVCETAANADGEPGT